MSISRSIKICLCALVLNLISAGIVHANEPHVPLPERDSKVITMAMLEFPPLTYRDAGSQECIGYAVELSRQLFAEHGYSIDPICAPAIRSYRMLQSGEADLTINIKSTSLLNQYVDFVEPRFGQLELIFLTHQTDGFEEMVSAIRGFEYNGQRAVLEERGYVFQDSPGSIDAVKIFARKRTRHLITYKAPYKFYLEQNGFEVPQEVSIENLATLPTFFAVSKKSDKHDEIIKILTAHAEKHEIQQFSELLPFF